MTQPPIMHKAKNTSQTQATQWLDSRGIKYTTHLYDYQDHGGARHAAAALGADPRCVAKTLIMEDEHARPLIIVMRGDQDVSTKQLARQTGAKRITPCAPHVAERHSGYRVGGTSPFGTRKSMPVWVEVSLLERDTIYINGGRRGFLVGIDPTILIDPLGARAVDVAL